MCDHPPFLKIIPLNACFNTSRLARIKPYTTIVYAFVYIQKCNSLPSIQIYLNLNQGRKTISEEEDTTSFFEQIMLATGNVATFIYKNSYIFTNVIMMVSVESKKKCGGS